MRVWYGFSKLTKKAVRKKELAIYFENSDDGLWRKKEEWISKRMHVVYEREQTEDEALDGKLCNRQFLKYSYFIDNKPFYGDIEKVLFANSEADKNNVSEAEREEIKNKLREAYYIYYQVDKEPVTQLKLNI